MERQDVQDAVVRRPFPGIHEGGDLRLEIGVRGDHALGVTGGAAGVHHQGAATRLHVRQRRARAPRRIGGVAAIRRVERRRRRHRHRGRGIAALGRDQRHRGRSRLARALSQLLVRDQQRRRRVGENPRHLGRRVRYAERNRYGAGTPDRPLCRHVIEARGLEIGDALAIEIGATAEQGACTPLAGCRQRREAVLTTAVADGDAAGKVGRTVEQSYRHASMLPCKPNPRRTHPRPAP
jgi:hypothetical protein